MPSTMESICVSAFEDCCQLHEITIPASVTEMDEHAFGYFCRGKKIYGKLHTFAAHYAAKHGIQFSTKPMGILPEDFEISKTRFIKYHGVEREVVIPDGITVIGKKAFWSSTVRNVLIPDSVTDIEFGAFAYSALSTLYIPASVKKIGDEAFERNLPLANIIISGSVEEIGILAFNECSGLKNLTIGNGVARIGANAFINCKHLHRVTIPPSVIAIGYHAFGYYFENPSFWEYCHQVRKFTICGKRGTAAARYARENGFRFEELDSL